MSSDQLLLAAVDKYFRALHACDTDLLDEVFHPAASLFDVDGGEVCVDPLASWRQDVATRPSPASAGQAREEEVVSVLWLSPDCATVHVRLRVLDEVFVDHLSFVRDRDSFRIVAKTWHLERTLATTVSYAEAPTIGVEVTRA
ncbi:nuclear transport factor 2 family protein [Nocardioides sp.]|uniref:nuclear transport factor 2 family protein n=1 Tax=Nocardioides sp. TaxID=35761 RepID=UPI002BFF6F38|nr:nuclear transport factor 2 family protein [Nocardioides sp.]HXH81237.1 nuclear transport factor 2 family protein [Nocardioides sp.]